MPPRLTRWSLSAAAICAVLAFGGAHDGSLVGVSPVAAQSGGGSDELSATDIAERIQKFYKETQDFKSNFKQVYTDVAAGEKKKSWGKVYFKKPGKMRWDYYKSADRQNRQKTLVSDGELFWIYELEFQQVFKKCLDESQLPTSLKFLMGKGNLVEDFEISFTDDSSKSSPQLELIPKKKTPKYKKVHFRVNPDSFKVVQTTVFGPYGNTNRIEFSNTQLNVNLPDSGFEFEPPEGARLLNPRKSCK